MANKTYEQGVADGSKATMDKIIKYVKTDEFKASWVNAKGEAFGDFFARMIQENV